MAEARRPVTRKRPQWDGSSRKVPGSLTTGAKTPIRPPPQSGLAISPRSSAKRVWYRSMLSSFTPSYPKTHDAIVFGTGDEGRRKQGEPRANQ